MIRTYQLQRGRALSISGGNRCSWLIAMIGAWCLCASVRAFGGGIDIVIEDNQSLHSLKGLEGVIAVNSVVIKSNPALTNLDGLKNLDRVIGALGVEANTALGDCKALAPVLGWPDGVAKRVGSASISGNLSMCASEADILASVQGPTTPIISGADFVLAAASTSSVIDMELDFTPATPREAIFPVTGHRASCSSVSFEEDPTSAIPLLDFTPVMRTLAMPGSAGRSDSAFVAEIEVGIDITHTDPVDLQVILENPEGIPVTLWDQSSPGSEDLIGIFPITLSPKESLNALARERMGGDWKLVVEDAGKGPILREGELNYWSLRISEESITDGGVAPPMTVKGVGSAVEYSCTLTALSRLGETPVSDNVLVMVPASLAPPAQPVIYATDYDDGAAILFVSVSDSSGAPITRYDATCTNGTDTISVSSTSPRIVVTGLTNGDAYTCSVTATNSFGTSSASALTESITPEAYIPGLPIWLLYQAIQ